MIGKLRKFGSRIFQHDPSQGTTAPDGCVIICSGPKEMLIDVLAALGERMPRYRFMMAVDTNTGWPIILAQNPVHPTRLVGSKPIPPGEYEKMLDIARQHMPGALDLGPSKRKN